MNPQGSPEVYGLIGWPVKHSYSAFMHEAAFAHCGLNATYRLFELPPEDLDTFFKKTIHDEKIRGFNITVPHKESALAYLDAHVSEDVKVIGALNTVRVRSDGLLEGFNTDSPGFGRDLAEHGVMVRGCVAALIGAGGGAKAVAHALCVKGAAVLRVCDVDASRSAELCGRLKDLYPHTRCAAVSSVGELNISNSNLLVNATPVGMKPEDPLLVPQEQLHPDLFVYDLIYNPSETKLIAAARGAGCRCANGLGMLLYQGVMAFEHWTGKEAPIDVMRRALRGGMHV